MMKAKNLTLAKHNNKMLLPILAIAGNMVFAPLTLATVYNSTVDLNATTLVNRDQIRLDGQTGLVSATAGSGALQLGNGSFSLELTNTAPDQTTYGVNLGNQLNNDFGIATSITVNQTAPPSTNTAYYSYAVLLGNQTNMAASDLNVNVASAAFGQGILGVSDNLIELGSGSTITVDASNTAKGVTLGKNGQFTADGMIINVNSNANVTGIQATGAKIDLGSGSHITTTANLSSGTSSGVELIGNAEFIADRLTIDATNSSGIQAGGTATIDLGSNSIINALDSGEGIQLLGTDISLKANELTVNTTGNYGHGLNLNKGASHVNLGSNTKIATTGNSAFGIWMVSDSSNILTADALTIHTTGAGSSAIELRKGHATIGGGSVLQTDNINAGTMAVYASGNQAASLTLNDSKLISNGSYAALSQGALSTVNLNNVAIEIDRKGYAAYALWATGGGGKINVNGMNLQGGAGVYGVTANNQGKITLAGDIIINTPNGLAIIADGSDASVVGNGKMTINGMLAAQNTALLDLSMTDSSVLNGAVLQLSNGLVNLTMDNSQWTFADSSSVNHLSLANNAAVNFQTAADGLLTINNLSGNGWFKMRTDLMNNSGDLINITGTTSGSHKVTVANSGSTNTDGSETLTIITTADGQGAFALTNQVELGGYLYDLQKTGNDWELYSSGRANTSTADASASFLNVGYLMNYAETQTLLQRLGELRQGSNRDHVWVRGFHGSFDSFAHSKLSGFDMSYKGLQLGVDKAAALNNARLYTGVFIGLTDSTQHYAHGDGGLKSQSAGLYASYITDFGAYLDGVLKYQYHRNRLNVADSQGNAISGKGSSNGLSASLEGGHRFHLTQQAAGVYIEPQLQLTYSWQDRATINNDNGLRVDLGRYDSLLGRVGTLIGYEVNQAGKTPINFYFKNSWQHEFLGQANYKLNGAKEDLSFKGGAWVAGVGVSAQLNNSHTIYLDMEKTTGKKFNQDQVNLGYRYSF